MTSQILSGQTAIVTGASSGIGAGIALGLGKAGAQVLVNYHSDEEGAQKVLAAIKEAGGKADIFKADVSKPEEADKLFAKAKDVFGPVDIVVTNAGIQKDAAMTEMSFEDWQTVLSVNLTGQFLCAQRAARVFRDNGVRKGVSKAAGKIICISSVHEVIPWAGHVNYATSKGGIMMMMKTMAQELAPDKIRVNSIAPGAIKTHINESVWSDPKKAKELLKLIPYGRIGDPEDVAKAAVWLASDESDYVTGTTMFVDGGMVLYPEFADNG